MNPDAAIIYCFENLNLGFGIAGNLHFRIGSKEDWDAAIRNQPFEFGVSRLVFTLLFAFLFFGVNVWVSWIFRKHVEFQKKRLLFELAILIVISIFSVAGLFFQ